MRLRTCNRRRARAQRRAKDAASIKRVARRLWFPTVPRLMLADIHDRMARLERIMPGPWVPPIVTAGRIDALAYGVAVYRHCPGQAPVRIRPEDMFLDPRERT